MSDRRVEGRSYGQRRPPLTSIIQSILERYPDGGQILKELIQNADDAGATKVSFLLDSRSKPYEKFTLYSRELGKFQGPALYVHNNARFQEEDWDGLQSLMLSNKKEDPLKVGRFGIGFNSIYHVTDLPSIVSGDRLAFLDPHEVYFGRNETGTQFRLEQPLLRDYPDQFAPYENVLDCKISTGFYDGTLFRFPLRDQPSTLSQKCYSAEKVRNLFNSLKEEASLIILFLKNVEEINVYETNDETKEKLVFRISLKDSCRADVREKRQDLLKRVPDWESGRVQEVEINLQMVVEIYDHQSGMRENKWVIHNRISASNVHLREIASRLHLLPWVGFAAPLTHLERDTIGSDGGRIFCFLPLPPDADARSGYPVHIHGYFGLTDNRRGLKWPGPECQNDDMAEWNVLLLNQVGSKAYTRLLEFMTQEQMKEPGTTIGNANQVYQCWPDASKVQKNWMRIIEPMMKLLATKKVLWTPSSSGKWIPPENAIIERLGSVEFVKTIINVLTLAQESVVTLPSPNLKLVDSYLKKHVHIRELTPTYFRALLKRQRQQSWYMANMTRKEKLAMLEYVTSDGNFADLSGISLLPLANGVFTEFCRGQFSYQNLNGAVFVASSVNPKGLLPKSDSRCLDETIAQDIFRRLNAAALDLNKNSQCMAPIQLIQLNPRLVITLMKQDLPKEWFQATDPVAWYPLNGYHPPEGWLLEVWKWLKIQFPYNIATIEGLPLIPCPTGGNTSLAKMVQGTKIIKQHGYITLPESVVRVLRKAGVIVLESVPSYIAQHSCLDNYVESASPEGVVHVLHNVGLNKSIGGVSASSVQDKRALREFLSSIRGTLSVEKKIFLRSLPLFESIDNISFLPAQKGSQFLSAAPHGFRSTIPSSIQIQNASTILSVDDPSNLKLLNVLDIQALPMSTFLMQNIFPYLSLKYYNAHQISSLMCSVLRWFQVSQNENGLLKNQLKELKFILLSSGTLVRPRDVFDPRLDNLKELFEGEQDKFPIGDFLRDDIVAILVSSLGLKQTPEADDLVAIVQKLGCFRGDILNRKADALLRFLNNNPSILQNRTSGGTILKNFLVGKKWVPRQQNKPGSYPNCMPWKTISDVLCSPPEITAFSNASIIGAVMPVLQKDSVNHISNYFGWNNCVPVDKILQQLRLACSADVKSFTSDELQRFIKMLKRIYAALTSAAPSLYSILAVESFPAWIWTGHGFASPNKISFQRGCSFDLEPYLYTIPEELQGQELSILFKVCGVKQSFTESDVLGVLEELKQRHDLGQGSLDVTRDRQRALEILHWVIRDGEDLSEELRNKVLVPVMSQENTLKLVPCNECTFCDVEWLRGNFFELQMLPDTSDFSLIHESISPKTASLLGVPPLSKCVTSPEQLGFEQAGPYEPITTRLKNILDEYKQGAGVFKELIQNADDAGASEVQFLVDWRQHPNKSVLSQGMKDCQGPALLAHNNAKFTQTDFANINKLAGATKKEDLEKIGRFGLGFNSVYHFTDVPSFISSKYAVFFDPHTSHLGHFILSPSHPGIKMDLAKKSTLTVYHDQFQPYSGVFDCNVSGDSPFNYDGTLFRFPFRRGPSDICNKQYYRQDVDELLKSFQGTAPCLLLNTQNVQKVNLWVLDEEAKDPSSMKLLFTVNKATVQEIDDKGCSSSSTFLHACAKWTKEGVGEPPHRSKVISIKCSSRDKTEETLLTKTQHWLISDRLGNEESLTIARSEEGKSQGLLSCAGVAAKLNGREGSWSPPEDTTGEAFCFLPLSIPTGLPVHVNGYFAVTSNRRGIWEQGTMERNYFLPLEVRWNINLMQDGVAKAYVQLLENASQLEQRGLIRDYTFSSLWPNQAKLQSQVWKPLLQGVYSLIVKSSYPLVQSGSEWLHVTQCYYPDKDLQNVPGSLQILRNLKHKVVDLPPFARKGFDLAGCNDLLADRTVTQERFLREMFFPNIDKIDDALRDQVMCHVLDECLRENNISISDRKELYLELLRNNRCIPCSEQPRKLAYPKDLVKPSGHAAVLFSLSDNRFPIGECYRRPERLLMLKQLGMIDDILTWDQVCERAESVQTLSQNHYTIALDRLSALISYLNDYINRLPTWDESTEEKLASLKIFPVAPKPSSYVLPWKGNVYPPNTMLSTVELYEKKHLNIVGASKPILDESNDLGCGYITSKVHQLFRIARNAPSAEEALHQLNLAVECLETETYKPLMIQESIQSVCNEIYQKLQELLDSEKYEAVITTLSGIRWVLVGYNFLMSKQLAFEWVGHGSPYLYSVPQSMAYKYSKLLQAAGVRRNFDGTDFTSALYKMKDARKEDQLNDSEFRAAKCFLDELATGTYSIPEHDIGRIPIPDHSKVLRPANDLVINDAPWLNVNSDLKYVNKQIPSDLAHTLGAKDIRSRSLEEISRPIGRAFGQKELLTDRLAGILKSYPCDVGILKELVQNADDAEATEIHFVYDSRHHEGERVFGDSWKELQGPALCVYNNRSFSEKDIEGIQRLGIGSKAESPEKTGQYGIGFNAVYHLTDCPSFITNGDTLCILDPHARYAPHASIDNPGRIIGPFDNSQVANFSDVFSGYLGSYFPLQGSTMFRLPLRDNHMANKSLISQNASRENISSLLRSFRWEAKEVLLFLNHVRKISISEVQNGELVSIYEVSALLQPKNETKCKQLAAHIRSSKHLPTHEINGFGITYPMTLQEELKKEEWIVRQAIGLQKGMHEDEVPDGKTYGLLPRGGVAAKIAEKGETSNDKPERYRAFCFLPLPVQTGLPVHVNGHFALDSGRRHLWKEDDDKGIRSQWNRFMRTRILAEAYIFILLEARRHIPYLKVEEPAYFAKELEARRGIEWFQKLFPSLKEANTNWKDLATAVLVEICSRDLEVLPFVYKDVPRCITQENHSTETSPKYKHRCNWVKSSEGFFSNLSTERYDIRLGDLLRVMGFKLLSLPHALYDNFMEADAMVKQITPDQVINFLKNNNILLTQLPCPINETRIGSVPGVLDLLYYCMKSSSFTNQIVGIPLLVTKDAVLRLFQRGSTVYMSPFSDLIPSAQHLHMFVNKFIVKALGVVTENLFQQGINSVVKPLSLDILQQFLTDIFPEHPQWRQTTDVMPWEPNGGEEAIAKWLQRLWMFISTEHKTSPQDNLLEPLKSWPVIPTTSGFLAPVSLSKTILDLTDSGPWSPNQVKVVCALKRLKCPEVNIELISSQRKLDLSAVLKPYLAYPNSPNDVVIVLDRLMKNESIDGRLNENDMTMLLQFFQEDPNTLIQLNVSGSVLKRLPFYKTIHGKFVSIENASSYYSVPEGLPLEESDVWMEGTGGAFLYPCQKLDLLYEKIGVQLKSHIDCYIEFIFPRFGQLETSTRMVHLNYIKDNLQFNSRSSDTVTLKSALKNLPFIPNASGVLCKAAEFYDSANLVFCVMLPQDKRPPSPFNKSCWLDFLREVGLQQAVSKEQFLKFAKEVEAEAALRNITIQVLKKSRILSEYLLSSVDLNETPFLRKVSNVKFLAAFNVPDSLYYITDQLNRSSTKDYAFIAFREAVPHNYMRLVWSSAALLPSWAIPLSKNVRMQNDLGILKKPTPNQVVTHVKKLSTKFSRNTDKDVPKTHRDCLSQVMMEIYTFIKGELNCSGPAPDDCTSSCRHIAELLHETPFILVEEGGVFVQCNQLAFDIDKHQELPPYLFKVPREYGPFDHLFKVLGALEKPSPSQYARVLEHIWSINKGKEMHPEEMRKAKSAVHGLFTTLSKLHKKEEKSKPNTALSGLHVLYLPNRKKQLRLSHVLVHVSDCPDLLRRIPQEAYDFLVELPLCGLNRDRQEDLLNCLPNRLKVKSLKSLVREELHPDYCDKKCRIDAEGKCHEANRLRRILFSKELTDGVIRILKAQEKSATLPDRQREKVESLKSIFVVTCCESLVTHLVSAKEHKPIEKSNFRPSCFIKDEDQKKSIYIRHGAKEEHKGFILCTEINQFLEGAFKNENLLHLQSIISFQRLNEIALYLDIRGIEQDVQALTQDALEPDLGSEIPFHLHYLLVQFEDFLFRPDEIVGYEREDHEDDHEDGQDPRYVFARIIRKVTPSHQGERKKKTTRDPATGKKKATGLHLLSRYLIDIGDGTPIEVDVLDLYKLKRPEELQQDGTPNPVFGEQALVPYEGTEGATNDTRAPSAEAQRRPHTWEAAMKEVRKALVDILKLPEDKHRKALRRLYLRWHPDKNPEMQELATKVMQFIQNEYESLLRGGTSGEGAASNSGFHSDWFSQWNRTARQQRSSYDNYRRHNPGFSRSYNFNSGRAGGWQSRNSSSHRQGFSSGHNFSAGKNYTGPSARMARIWLAQSRGDLESVRYLLSSRTPFYWLVCFQCHQVAEKTLKAALISVCGVSDDQLESHDVLKLAGDLGSLPRSPDVTESAAKLWSYYESTRSPHKHEPPKAPKDVYTFQQAQEAFEIAKEILGKLEEFIGVLHR